MTDMDDKRLDDLLDDAATTWRTDATFDADALWGRIEQEAFAPAPQRRTAPSWRTFAMGIAASLVIGVLAGRLTATSGAAFAPAGADRTPAQLASESQDPYQRSAEEFLGQSAVLLAALPANASNVDNTQLVDRAGQLLSKTRVLLDSPVGADPRMRGILEDLELVLTQVARMPARRQQAELTLITDALQERDLVPRIRSAVADLSSAGY
jgi:hypothetical protein